MNHVNTKVLAGLAGAALVAIIAASIISSNRKPASESAQPGGYALAELRDHVNDVTHVVLTVAEDRGVVTLSKSDSGWTVKEKGGYRADFGKLRELLLKLEDASLLQQKTANEQRYPELGVEDVKAKDARGVKLTIEGLAKPAQLIVGNYSDKSGGTFVRRQDDKQSWLAKGNLTIDRDPSAWIDKSITQIGSERFDEINLAKPGAKPVRLFKSHPSDAQFKLDDVPAGREASESVLSGLASTLSGLSLVDVAPLKAVPMPGDDKLLKAVFHAFDGLKVNIWGWKQDDKRYVRLSAVLEHDEAVARITADQAKAKAEYEERLKIDPRATAPSSVSDPVTDREQRLARLASEVGEISVRVEGWVYVIPSDKYVNMDKTLDDLLKPLKSVKPDIKPADDKKPDVKTAAGKKSGRKKR